MLNWSNESEEWWINQLIGRLKKGESGELDANQILVPGRLKDIKEILTHLAPLPLHSSGPRGGSREFREWNLDPTISPHTEHEHYKTGHKLNIEDLERWSRGEFLEGEMPDE